MVLPRTASPHLAPIVLLFAFLLMVPRGVWSQALHATDPASVGMSAATLAQIDTTLQGYVDRGAAPGFLAMVARNGAVAHVSMQGWADREGHVRIGEQTLFRWHSMTKPLTSVAVLLLVEEGKLSLDAPVAQYLPSLIHQ